MKNKTEFSKNDIIQTEQFINVQKTASTYDENQYSKVEQKQNKKSPSKVIKGKVKVYHNNNRSKLINHENLDDDSELNLISERMLLFLKFTFLSLLIIALFMLIKINI